jgi:hypothetical protein
MFVHNDYQLVIVFLLREKFILVTENIFESRVKHLSFIIRRIGTRRKKVVNYYLENGLL